MLGKIAILGPGVLGGSIGLAARHRKVARHVAIWARRIDAADEAWKLGAADEASHDLAKIVSDADLVILATPIGVMPALAAQVKPLIRADTVVTDVGSVKYPVVTTLTQLFHGHGRYVGSHPMAGSEQAGIEAAKRDLFENAVCILTPTDGTDKPATKLVHDFWCMLGCQVRTLSPQAHDEVIARVSHLPHLVAAAVVNVVCHDGPRALDFSGPGFKDFTRIASGPADMWTEICIENRHEIARGLDALIEHLTGLRAALENSDAVELRAALKKAKHYRDELRFRV